MATKPPRADIDETQVRVTKPKKTAVGVPAVHKSGNPPTRRPEIPGIPSALETPPPILPELCTRDRADRRMSRLDA